MSPSIVVFGCNNSMAASVARYLAQDRGLRVAIVEIPGTKRKRKYLPDNVSVEFVQGTIAMEKRLHSLQAVAVVDCRYLFDRDSEDMMRACVRSKNVSYIGMYAGSISRNAALQLSLAASRSRVLLLPNAGLHISCFDCVLAATLRRRKVRLRDLTNSSFVCVGLHYDIRKNSIVEALAVVASTLIAIVDGAHHRGQTISRASAIAQRRVLTGSVAGALATSPAGSLPTMWCNVRSPIIDAVRRVNSACRIGVFVSVDASGGFSWGRAIVSLTFWLLSLRFVTWILQRAFVFKAIVRAVERVRARAMISATKTAVDARGASIVLWSVVGTATTSESRSRRTRFYDAPSILMSLSQVGPPRTLCIGFHDALAEAAREIPSDPA